jgi:hypothetical protein
VQLSAFRCAVLAQVLVRLSSLVHSVLECLDFWLVFIAFAALISLLLFLADLDNPSHDFCCEHPNKEVLVSYIGHVEPALSRQ